MDIQQLYLAPAGRSYREDFRSFVTQWKLFGRKATSDDLELIFSMIKDAQGSISAGRSSSIKRAGTKTLRTPIVDGLSLSRSEREREHKEQEGKIPVGEIFGEILSVLVAAMVKEQSFIMEFLHLSPRWKCTYEEFVGTADETNWMQNLENKRPPELDKVVATEVSSAMDQILSWLPDELSSIIEWCRTLDTLYTPLINCLTLAN
jgi:hypothetical protein